MELKEAKKILNKSGYALNKSGYTILFTDNRDIVKKNSMVRLVLTMIEVKSIQMLELV